MLTSPVSAGRENRFPTVLPTRVLALSQGQHPTLASERTMTSIPRQISKPHGSALTIHVHSSGNLLEVWEKGNETVPEFELTS